MKPTKTSTANKAGVPDNLISLSGTVQSSTIDTLKVGFPLRLLDIPKRYYRAGEGRLFDRLTSDKVGEGERVRFRLRSEVVKEIRGLAELSFTPPTETDAGGVILRLSAKALGRNYWDGIHAGNIETALREVMPAGIRADTYGIVQDAAVFEVHPCTNYPRPAIECLPLFVRLPFDRKRFTSTTYGRGTFTTVEWRSILKTSSVKLHAYCKTTEMLRRPAEAEALDIERFSNITRLEAQLRKLSDIRAAYGIETKGVVRLEDILSPAANRRALLHTYDTIIWNDLEQLMKLGTKELERERQAETSRHTGGNIYEFVGMIFWYEMLSGDWRAFEAEYRSRYKRGHNISRQLKRARELWARIAAQEWNDEAAIMQDEGTRLRSFLKTGQAGWYQDKTGTAFHADGTPYGRPL